MYHDNALTIRDPGADEEIPYHLLLEADPSRELVDAYLKDAKLRLAYLNDKLVGVYVLRAAENRIVEIMNISIETNLQGRGFGKHLILDAVNLAKSLGALELIVATGNSSISQLAFYQKCGFRISKIVPDHFLKHYPEKIIEDGIWCRDQIILSMDLKSVSEHLLRRGP
ncbi:MAG: GNAT family N-acetyltransferase [Candidatus Obscuribacterales bacterium]|nr:GNAT family N-acetyltransferase [Cyanobacteria bacterium HKST-UBA01]MCB9471616.1 GNAT family N-acetyltransferase [Candidatus Obscuribacterales bacterium]